MDLYKYLWWQGNSNLDSVLAHFEDPIEELDRLLREEKISIHRADYGKVWISCPAFHKGNAVEQAIISSPGITAGELQEKLGLSRQQFYERINGLKLKKVKDGRKTRYYPADGTHSPDEVTEDRREPSEDARELFNKFQGYAGFDFTLGDIEANLRGEEEGDEFGEWRMSLASEEDLRKLRMIFVKKGIPVDKDFTLQEISESWGEGKTTCLKILRRLTDAGLLSRNGKTWRKT